MGNQPSRTGSAARPRTSGFQESRRPPHSARWHRPTAGRSTAPRLRPQGRATPTSPPAAMGMEALALTERGGTAPIAAWYRPLYSRPMDPLADVLRLVRLDGAYFYKVEASDRWCVESPSAEQLTPRILPSAEHLISYHFLTAGRCFVGLAGREQVEMLVGDALVFPHGDAYVMSSERGLKSTSGTYHTPNRFPHVVELGTGLPRNAEFVCGFLGCDRRPFNPLLASLPNQLHLKALSPGSHSIFTALVVEESREGRAGSASVLSRLAEVMFIEVMRRYLDELPPGGTGWLAGLRDEIVGKALALLHARPEHHWSVAELAREVASSRSKLTERFTHMVGQPPIQYLAQWRLQVAAKLLREDGDKVAVVGSKVGYDSEAAFSRAFKKGTGLSPGAWRTTRRAPQA